MRSYVRNERGSVALELCLLTPLLLFMFIAIFDFGFLFFQQMQVEAAADAGALYAFHQGSSGYNASNIEGAVTSASYPTQTAITANASKACGCPNAAGTDVSVVTCGTNCTAGPLTGYAAATYALITASVTPTPIFNWPGYPATVKSGVVVRLP